MLTNPVGTIWADPGGGKTAVTLKMLAALFKEGAIRRALVLAPLRPAYLVWPKELKKWSDFHGLTMDVLHGPKKDEVLARGAQICVTNYESMPWLFNVTEEVKFVQKMNPVTHEMVEKRVVNLIHDMKRARALGFDVLIIDEVTAYKNATSIRSRLLKPLLPLFSRRWGLTGTPATNGLKDLFGQTYVIDRGRTFGPYITGFRREYFDSTGYGGYDYVPKPDAEKQILKALKPIVFRLDAKEYADDIPKLVVNDIPVELPPKARKLYDEMERQMFSEMDGLTFTAVSAGVASNKCRQIAGGGLFVNPTDQDGVRVARRGDWVETHAEKTGAFIELVDSLQGRPLLVAYEFTHELERMRAALKKNFGYDLIVLGKGVSMKKSEEIELAWNRGDIRVLAGHPKAIGHGLNLQESSNHVAFCSPTWDLALYEQFVKRVLRSGNPFAKVYLHRILALDTVEQAVVLAIEEKGETQQRLLNAFTRYRKLRGAA